MPFFDQKVPFWGVQNPGPETPDSGPPGTRDPPGSLIDHFLIPKRSLSPAKIRGLFFWSGPYFPEDPLWGVDSGTQGPGPEKSRFPVWDTIFF